MARRHCLQTGLILAVMLCAHQIRAEGDLTHIRIGTSGDYPPFSEALSEKRGSEPGYQGFDIALASAWAKERGLEIEWVRFYWSELAAALQEDRFDVAMSGITVRPERAAVGQYSIATVETSAVILVRDPERRSNTERLDRPDVRIGVNAGGHLERVARKHFPHATLLAIPNNASVLDALRAEAVDAVVTETHEARLWQAEVPGSETQGPLTRDRKAWLVSAKRADLAADLDTWLLAKESDGSLARLREQHLGPGAKATAQPLRALFAALDERLSLMPLVGAAKREQGIPLEVPEREQIVLDAAAEAVRVAADSAGVTPPDPSDIARFFRAQMNAAKEVQWKAVQDRSNTPKPPLPDLEGSLRPGLLQIGERIARLLVRLPAGASDATIRGLADEELRAEYLSAATKRSLSDAVSRLIVPTQTESSAASAP